MLGIFKSALSELFGRRKAFFKSTAGGSNQEPTSPYRKTVNISSEKAQNPSTSSNANGIKVDKSINKERCQRILNYWLDAELFDLPVCPVDYKKQLISEPADNFKQIWGESAEENFKKGKLKISEKSRLLVMFQCHRAGYIAQGDEKHPNYKTPRTYLVGQGLIPTWNEEKNCFLWIRSEEDEDLTINLATIRTLFRRCNSSIPNNMSLAEWVEARMESIENILHLGFLVEGDTKPISTSELQIKIKNLNRELAGEFWPDETSRKFMLEQCQPVDSAYDTFLDQAEVGKKTGAVTFRWRFCYYPDGLESKQLGPFFVDDIQNAINSVNKFGTKGLSKPLESYLVGKQDQIKVPNAVNQGHFFGPLTRKIIYGRWPENPKYGLSLLQSFAVNTSVDVDKNPIVAVNGPPGTGKTTLLKDVIANKLVQRTSHLSRLAEQNDWFDKPEATQLIMEHSMVVASSNNKAVENISKELPSLSKLTEEFRSQTKHFESVAPEGDWGLFCAVLGNSSNRQSFKPILKKLKSHLRNVTDIFYLNNLVKDLKDLENKSVKNVVSKFVNRLQKEQKLEALVDDIQKCHAYKKFDKFFVPFTQALRRIESSELAIDDFLATWESISDEQLEVVVKALEAFKKQWFGKKLYKVHSEQKVKNAKNRFDRTYKKIQTLSKGASKEWGLQLDNHLMNDVAYQRKSDESDEEAEKRLQQLSPWGSEALNRCRSELFVNTMALNEAILESSTEQFSKHWQNLEQLIDGRLETNETIPEHQQLWSLLFLFFPVISTSLSSVESQFRLMQKRGGFGLSMIDEAGQAVNYHVAGILQRSKQVIFVGDPIQLEPVVTMPPSIDIAIASDFIPISNSDEDYLWGDAYLISKSSAQSIGDNAGQFMAHIGERKVGIPLLVHRRCTEPMFSIANKIAYDNRMVLASQPFDGKAIQSGWINVSESKQEINTQGYSNQKEASVALDVIEFLAKEHPGMVAGGVYIITPFTNMSFAIKKEWSSRGESQSNHGWMKMAFGKEKCNQDLSAFADDNIGTVHTFQGKEASTVIICTAASKVRNKTGGITWVNGKPNLLNVAVTRAKHHLFVVGNMDDWAPEPLSSELQTGRMLCYENLCEFKLQNAKTINEFEEGRAKNANVIRDIEFDFS